MSSTLLVSIPFIAGQWSLYAAAGAFALARGTSLNPLHCGAVVAFFDVPVNVDAGLAVSIPFIAGQWSLSRARPGSREKGD